MPHHSRESCAASALQETHTGVLWFQLVKHLSPQDALHFVTYDSEVETLFMDGDLTDGGKRGLEQQIKTIRAGTATNLMAGLNAGADALLHTVSARRGGPAPAACRIMLFSDGLVNAGERRSEAILHRVRELYAKHHITISTFGIGTDFDEALMTGIAEVGRGHYGFLGSAAEIPAKISASLHSLLELSGTDASVTIEAPCGRVTRVYGDSGDGVEIGGRTATVLLGDLHADNTRSVLVEVEVSALNAGDHRVVETALRYATSGDDCTQVQLNDTASVTATTDERALAHSPDGRVVAATVVYQASDRDKSVMEAVRRGDNAAAVEIQTATVAMLENAIAEAGPDHAELVHGVLTAARASLERLTAENQLFDADEYCMETTYRGMQSRRLSARCLRDACDSDSERDWSDGWSGDESTSALRSSTIVRRYRRTQSLFDSDESGDSSSDEDNPREASLPPPPYTRRALPTSPHNGAPGEKSPTRIQT